MALDPKSIEEFKILHLRGAVCEYLDEGLLEDFYRDLRKILEDEEDKMQKMADNYKRVRRQFFSK